MRANFIFSEVWIGLRRNLTMTIAVVVTVAIGMALLGVGLMINAQVSNMKNFWADKVEISVFLCSKDSPFEACKNSGGVTAQEREALRGQIKQLPEVHDVFYENAAAAYENFKLQYGADSVLVNAVKVEDMPESFRVKLKDPENYGTIIETLKGQPGVSNVVNQKEILEQFFGLLERLRWAALAVAFILVFAAILLIGNTVRLSAYNRRRETGIMRLVGASNLYIQLPFVMEGMIAGLVGGVVAASMLIVAKVFLFESLAQYLPGNSALGWDDVASVILLTMGVGVIICVLASFVTLRRYLRV
ncbi:permease-like cell division protein FtsX [Spongiactinospora sp. TRM90649]|uniref:permease-like cell division protein FtsX n=1 Tax=Spongiactinospora sp. TRM90649 TaxID=3031114 RepID=UPI0023F9390C|nr:permease-like cell division protein FtsX [Spongiactinospora sp. TRM90649]MDF5751109.1 permease-like cell division protein FtsX [Spongiactinospora sp. TRM90649]